jgi:hypothetical protein
MRHVLTALALGIVGAAILCAVAEALSRAHALDLMAVLLAVAGTIYIGSGLADGRLAPILVETGIGAVYIAISLAGLWISPLWLVIGWAAHGVWDLAHHGMQERAYSAQVRVFVYPLACLSFDLVIAGYVALRYLQ